LKRARSSAEESRSAKGLARPAAAVVPARAKALGLGGSVGPGFAAGGGGGRWGWVALWIAEQAIEQLLGLRVSFGLICGAFGREEDELWEIATGAFVLVFLFFAYAA
jgi:hypothetical protein